jgi:CheY-like chemotaxis protein
VQKPIRILLVDDQPRVRRSARALPSTWTRAPDIREAVRLVEELPPDLVLMDVRMPDY